MASKTTIIPYKIILGFIPLTLVWVIDWFTKKWAMNLRVPRDFGLVHLELIYNNGLFFGYSSDLPLLVKTVTLTTFGAMILGSYIALVIVAPMKSFLLRLGLSVLVGGILGNVTDRLLHSVVIDFIAFKFYHLNSPVMNVADIAQWIGYACIIFGLHQDSKYYWPTVDLRNKFFINPRFQIRTGIIMGLGSFVTGFILLVFGYSFFRDNFAPVNIKFFLFCGSVLIFFLSTVQFCFGVVLSHRVAGPLYAIDRHLNNTYQGKKLDFFKLRENDEFKELEISLSKLNCEMHRLYEFEKYHKKRDAHPSLTTDEIPEIETIKKVS